MSIAARAQKPKPRIEIGKCFVDWYDIEFGQTIYICRSREFCHPLGLAWGVSNYGDKGRTFFQVMGSFVVDWARRRGVRTLINKTILQHYSAIASPAGTKSGEAFMRGTGYATDPLLGWVLRKPADAKPRRK